MGLWQLGKASPEQLILSPNELETHRRWPFDPEVKATP